jgi:hypothetical protein
MESFTCAGCGCRFERQSTHSGLGRKPKYHSVACRSKAQRTTERAIIQAARELGSFFD